MVTYCTHFCTPPAAPADTLGSIKRVSAYDTLEFTVAEAIIEATFPSQYYIWRELLAENTILKLTIRDSWVTILKHVFFV